MASGLLSRCVYMRTTNDTTLGRIARTMMIACTIACAARADAAGGSTAKLPRCLQSMTARSRLAPYVDYLRANNLPMRLVVAPDPVLNRPDWPGMLEIRRGRAEDPDPVGLTTAFAGIAETGTLMLLSSAATPTTVAFLPETSIVALPSARVLRGYEDALRLLHREHAGLPRSINLVTGPSRSGDIAQQIVLGAHGPRRLHIIVVTG